MLICVTTVQVSDTTGDHSSNVVCQKISLTNLTNSYGNMNNSQSFNWAAKILIVALNLLFLPITR